MRVERYIADPERDPVGNKGSVIHHLAAIAPTFKCRVTHR